MEFINANDLPAAGTMATDNKVIVQQGDKFVLMTLAELLEYVASASVVTDPSLTLEGVAAEALATGKAVKAARAVNLLDNSDFRNPVNQRGKTSYNNGYTIDRWNSSNGNVNVIVGDGKITLSKSKTGGTFCQYLPFDVTGKRLTLAINTSIGLLLHSFVSDGDDLLKIEGLSAYFGVKVTDGITQLLIYFSDSSTIEFDLYWAALYEGEFTAETLPEYQPKGYAAELAECQRYFVALNGNADESVMVTDGATNGTTFYAFIPLPTAMRGTAVPTVTYKSVDVYPYTVGIGVPVTDLSAVTIPASRNAVCIRFGHAASDMAAKTPGTLRLSAGGYIHISADL